MENDTWTIENNFMNNQRGQALIMVVLVGVIALIAVASATTLAISELKRTTTTTLGVSQYHITYGAMENAFMQLLRNPDYSGETVMLDGSTCTITATAGLTKTVEVRCVSADGSYVRKLTATVTFSGGTMTVSGISEIP